MEKTFSRCGIFFVWTVTDQMFIFSAAEWCKKLVEDSREKWTQSAARLKLESNQETGNNFRQEIYAWVFKKANEEKAKPSETVSA